MSTPTGAGSTPRSTEDAPAHIARVTPWESGWEIEVGSLGVTCTSSLSAVVDQVQDLVETLTGVRPLASAIEIRVPAEHWGELLAHDTNLGALVPGLLDVLTPEQAGVWWDSPQSRWQGATPREMLPRVGPEVLLEAARAISDGVYS